MPILMYFRQYYADNVNMDFKRILNLPPLLKEKSHFLFGPRATGKSWLIDHQLMDAQVFDLLDDDVYSRLLRRPRQLGDEIEKSIVVIDEVQKLPRILDEVHRLIEKQKIRFLLTGSSALKLKRGGANLLAGRARSIFLFPLTIQEIQKFDLFRYINCGGLPAIYLSNNYEADLKAYVNLYLREEIQAESIVRRVDHFARFLDVIGLSSGKELNYQNIANDALVPPRTVAGFVEILKDTLVAFELEPFRNTKIRKSATKSKIFLFDVGVANILAGRTNIVEKSDNFGIAFEHFILQEIRARLSYSQRDLPMNYWRSQRGEFEVDCILGREMAIEIKGSRSVTEKHLTGLKAFKEEGLVKEYFLVSLDPVERKINGINLLPYTSFFSKIIC